MRKIFGNSLLVAAFAIACMFPYAKADDKKDVSDEVKRMDSAASVMNEIMGTPDKGIPQEILSSAKCVAVVPSMLKGGFVVGANYGKGVATCHTATGWSAPAPFKLAGGSVGFQIGGEAVDVVMLIMNDKGMRNLLNSKFKLGADASVAAGPVGRHAEGDTDWKMRAEVLSYSRARGVFAGVFERCTANILTQVEELRSIASEFSTYSAIPRIDRPDLVSEILSVRDHLVLDALRHPNREFAA